MAIEEVADGAGEGADSIPLAEWGATGCGAAKVVADEGPEKAGGGDDNAAKGFVLGCAGAGDVADWKSSKSSSPPAVLLCNVPKSSMTLVAGAVELPLVGRAEGAGSSSKLNKSFAGSFLLAAGGWLCLFGRLVLVVAPAVVLFAAADASSAPASYSSKSSPCLCVP